MHVDLIADLTSYPYIAANPPKSTDVPKMIDAWKASVEQRQVAASR